MKRILTVISVVAVVVIAIFIARIFPRWLHARGGQAEAGYTHVALDGIAFASTNYFQIYGKWPASLRDFAPDSPQNPKHDGFLTYARTFSLATGDGWQHPLIYKPFDPSVGYGSVISYGRDGQPGGVGLDADVEVHFGETH
jgi:type II secretory pathway pseudopilin PulG